MSQSQVTFRAATVPDEYMPPLWHQLPQLARRVPGRPWTVAFATVPMILLHCPYPTPGGHDTPGGIMAVVGWPDGSSDGKPITGMAEALRPFLPCDERPLSPALDRVRFFYRGGLATIRSVSQPMAFCRLSGRWFVREGMHRAIALALLRVEQWEALDLDSIVQHAA